MKFKQALIYTFSTLPNFTEDALEKYAFVPCGSSEHSRGGFVIPNGFDSFVGYSPDRAFALICLQVEEKILHSSVINDAVNKRVKHAIETEDRTPGKRERNEFKDEAIFDLLPRAFTKKRRTYAIVDFKNHLFIVDGSANRGDEITSLLRETLGSLPVVPIKTNAMPSVSMTDWLVDGLPSGFALGDYCKLEQPGEGGAINVCRNEDLTGGEITGLISAGRNVVEISLRHGPLYFVLTDSLGLKSLHFSDIALEEAAEDTDGDPLAIARADLILTGSAIANLVLSLANIFGGQMAEAEAFSPQAERRPLTAVEIEDDPLISEAMQFVKSSGRASISALQRSLRVGYNRAARLIEKLESMGVVSAMASDGSRVIL